MHYYQNKGILSIYTWQLKINVLLDRLGVNEYELMNGFYVISTLFAGVLQTFFPRLYLYGF